MSKLLFSVGLLAICVGSVVLGFGIPYNAFSFGNTLILSGTIMVAAGIVVIGLSTVLRQLQLISLLLEKSAVRGMAVTGDVPAPDRNAGAMADTNWHTDQNFEPDEGPAPLHWLRAKSKSASPNSSMPEPPPVAPLLAEAAIDAASSMTSLPKRPRSSYPTEEPTEANSLDAPETIKDPGELQFAWSEQSPRIKNGPDQKEIERAVPNNITGSVTFQRDEKAVEPPEPAFLQASGTLNPTLLKAGIIDGMAYRLYSDGSIEAGMSQGLIKFSSIDELRLHLEKQN